ncbi:MAG: NAD-binding protein [Actinobacteria bacterium]|nr:NAD-binding protein [Actinomycetota bacterium]
MHAVIAGCGRVGAQLAVSLSSENHDVVIIDRKANAFKRLGDKFHGLCIEGIAFDEETLINAGIRRAGVFTAVTGVDKSNLMAGLVVKRIFNVPKIMSRIDNSFLEDAVSVAGLEKVCGTRMVSDEVLKLLFCAGNYRVLEKNDDYGLLVIGFTVPQEASGMPVSELCDGKKLRVAAISHDNREECIESRTRLACEDQVILVSLENAWSPVGELPGIEKNVLDHIQDGEPEDARIIIGGCSKVGARLAMQLMEKGFRISVIDDNPEKSERVPANSSVQFIEGLIYEESALVKAGVEEATAFIAVGKLDNENLMAAEVAKRIFNVPRVLSRVFNPDKEATYHALGTKHVCGTEILYRSILGDILHPKIRTLSYRALLDYDLVEFECPPIWHGRSLGSLASGKGMCFIYLIRGRTCNFPERDLVLAENDILGALATPGMLLKVDRHMEKKGRWLPSTW